MIDPRTLFITSEEVAAAKKDIAYFKVYQIGQCTETDFSSKILILMHPLPNCGKEHGVPPEGKDDACMWVRIHHLLSFTVAEEFLLVLLVLFSAAPTYSHR